MACTVVDSVDLEHVSGPRALKATWVYTGNSHLWFRVILWLKWTEEIGFLPYREEVVNEDVREHTFDKLHLNTGQEWKATVSVICKDCTETEAVESPPLVAGCCFLGTPPAFAGCSYTLPDFHLLIPQADLDGACPADSVDVEITDPAMSTTVQNVLRAAWAAAPPNYDVLINDGAPASGTWTFRVRERSDCGNLGNWSAPCQVVIP